MLLPQINALQTCGTGDRDGERARQGCLKFAMEGPPGGRPFCGCGRLARPALLAHFSHSVETTITSPSRDAGLEIRYLPYAPRPPILFF
jgi:hypothetical protein